MRYMYNPEWYRKKYSVICAIILVVSLIFIVCGGVLFGFLDSIKPFNALPIAVIMIALGAFGAMVSFVILIYLLGYYQED